VKRTIMKSTARWCTLLVVVLWLVAMFLLTWAVAADMLLQVKNKLLAFAMEPPRLEITRDEYSPSLPGDREVNALNQFQGLYQALSPRKLFPIMTDSWLGGGFDQDSLLWGKWNLVYGIQPAVVYDDDQNQIIAKSGSFLSFCYSSREYGSAEGRAYVELDAIEGAEETFDNFFKRPESTRFLYNGRTQTLPMMRMSGRFEGGRFCPVSVDICYHANHYWQNLLTLEDRGTGPRDVIYCWDIRGFSYDDRPVRVGGVSYASLTDYLSDRFRRDREDNLFDAVITYSVGADEAAYGRYGINIAVRCFPVLYAVLRLLPCYLLSALAAAAGLVLYLHWVRKRLAEPVAALNSALKYGTVIPDDGKLEELTRLQQLLAEERKTSAEKGSRVLQLEQALDYARNAEENRRRLVSDITHELKTPLAVIHSYAECLQADVVPEKREQYLSVILEEVRSMDGTVLQMLDLSRLEAGKVRLNQDRVSLGELAQAQLAKLAPMAEAKGLAVSQEAAAFLITADKGRMEQAVSNLIGNAVKYTTKGGRITVKLRLEEGTAVFAVENTAPPLSEEALDKVWDSFYRADPSRSEPGTGLGLSLVKNIIRLHGGECFVRNTSLRNGDSLETAVEFGFRIPLK